MENQTEPKWYQKQTGIIILLILFFPVGLYLMWKYQLWTKKSRWIVSGVLALLVIANYGKKPMSSSYSSSSFSSKTCKMSGCNQNGQGWHHDLESAELRKAGMYGAYRIAESGGYCSRDHAYSDNQIKRAN